MMLSVTQLAPVWVVEKASGRDPGPAYVLASRLGCLFRRVSMDDLILDSHLEGRRAPGLILTSGVRGGYAALRAGRRAQCPVVWCVKGETRSAPMLRSLPFDLVVASSSAAVAPKFCPTLGPLTAVSPHVLAHAGRAWQERLEHLPHPRIAVNLGDGAFRTPEEALLLGKKLALMVNRYGGSVLLSVREDTHPELTDAFIVGLSASFILVWRTGEPDEDPTLGFMACADTVVVLGGNAVALVEACAVDVPVFLMEREQDLRGARGRLVRRLIEDHHLRLLEEDFVAWPRPILDEAGRIAHVMKARWAL